MINYFIVISKIIVYFWFVILFYDNIFLFTILQQWLYTETLEEIFPDKSEDEIAIRLLATTDSNSRQQILTSVKLGLWLITLRIKINVNRKKDEPKML